jgi:hypothetical protein
MPPRPAHSPLRCWKKRASCFAPQYGHVMYHRQRSSASDSSSVIVDGDSRGGRFEDVLVAKHVFRALLAGLDRIAGFGVGVAIDVDLGEPHVVAGFAARALAGSGPRQVNHHRAEVDLLQVPLVLGRDANAFEAVNRCDSWTTA